MYEVLVAHLRECANLDPSNNTYNEAADAIEDLQEQLGWKEHFDILTELDCNLPKWIPIQSRPMDEEERQYYSEHYGYELTDEEAIIYWCHLPEDGEEVLVCNKYGNIWIDTFSNDPYYGVGFEENGDMDGIVAWMPKPKPYEPPQESES